MTDHPQIQTALHLSPLPQKSPSIVSLKTLMQLRKSNSASKTTRESLKKYYATPEKVKQAKADILRLALVKVAYSENGTTKEEKALGRKAAALIPQVSQQAREMYTSSIEEIFIKNGMDVQVSARGADKKELRISYALMSQPLVYKFQNEIKISEQAAPLGFTKLVYTNGFESSLGKTWTIDLRQRER